MKRLLFTALAFSIALLCFSQDAWELTNISDKDWNVSGNLSINRYTNGIELRNTLPIKNYVSSTKDGLTKMLSEGHPFVVLDANKLGTAFVLSFDVKNKTIPPREQWDKYSFWMIDIAYVDKLGRVKSNKNWVARTPGNPNHEYNYNPNGSYKGLGSPYGGGVKPSRSVEIYSNDNKLYVSIGDEEVASIDDVASIRSVKVYVSAGTTICIDNTKCRKMTVFGQALPYLQKAMDCLDNNNPSSAANEITAAINKGIKCYDTYLIRGLAYYLQGFYKSAIEDLTSAIGCSSNNKEKAYFYRGMSKLALDDDNGISDLRNGGQEGIVFLRENDLMDYDPGKKKKNVTVTPKRNSPTQTKKPILKK